MGSFLPGSNPRIGRGWFRFSRRDPDEIRPTIWVRFSRATWRSQGDPASPSRPRSPVVHWKPRDRPPAFRRSSESDTRREPPPSAGREARRNMTNRREFYRLGAIALGNVFGLALAIPGIKFLLDPLGKKAGGGEFRPLTRLGQLKVGEPESFAVIAARQDAWVRFPPEPVGSVWLVRQPEGSKEPVVAFTAECPHLSCPVNLAGDRKSFFCPCHNSGLQLRRVADQRRLAPGDGHPGGRALPATPTPRSASSSSGSSPRRRRRSPLLNNILGWLEQRTGLVSATRHFLDHPVPGGARWKHALGFALATSLLVELVTGVLLMLTYSPATSTAWGSVYYITHQVDLGWFIRGAHRFGSYRLGDPRRPLAAPPGPRGPVSGPSRGPVVAGGGGDAPDHGPGRDRQHPALGPARVLGGRGRDDHRRAGPPWSGRRSSG